MHYAIPHASSALIARSILKERGYNLPFVTTLHGTDITLVGKDPGYKPVVEYSINHSDGCLLYTSSRNGRTATQKYKIQPPGKTVLFAVWQLLRFGGWEVA